jgi:predicted nucleic acid-binding protein
MAGRSKIVLDSSVIVKWFTREEKSQNAVQLLDSFVNGSLSIIVSDLAFYEVANALVFKPDFSREDMEGCISRLIDLDLETVKLDEILLGESSRIAFVGRVTFYDAVPVGIAKLRKLHCLTADRKTQFGPLSRKGYPIELLE